MGVQDCDGEGEGRVRWDDRRGWKMECRNKERVRRRGDEERWKGVSCRDQQVGRCATGNVGHNLAEG